MQSFILPANGAATPKSIERKRKMAEAMLAQGMDTSPVGHWTQGAARMANALVGGLGSRKADKQEAEGMASAREAMIKALNGDKSAVADAISNPFMGDNSAELLGHRWKQLNPDPADPYTLGPGDLRMSGDNQEVARGLPKTPDSAIYNNFTPSGEVPDGELRKELQKTEAKSWGELQTVANVSAQTAQDLSIVDELITMAPQGPIQGRLAEYFPGFSSSASALDSIVKRLAPTLRVPGSGSTSDIEYEGMLRGYPALRNRPEANALISQIMKAKAQINVERGQIVDQYSSGQIDAPTARAQLNEINKRSILSPEMRRLLAGVDSTPQEPSADGWSVEEVQ